MSKRRIGRNALLGAAALTAAFMAVVWRYREAIFDTELTVQAYSVETDKVTAPVRLAALSDLHSCAYGENQAELLGALRSLTPQPDVILLVGDIVDDELPEENAWTAISQLAESYPCFYVTGNHEWWTGDAERICREMERYGVSVLRGNSCLLSVENGGPAQVIQLCGIDDPDFPNSGEQLAQVGGQADNRLFSILMAHRPEGIGSYLEYPFDLVVSGHAHGGQWRIPGLLNGLYAPSQGLFPRYAGGQYSFGQTSFTVSRGLARESTRVPRIFNPPEIVVVDIIPR